MGDVFWGLLCILIVILFIPTFEDDEIEVLSDPNHCSIHKWESRDSGLEDGSKYIICSVCHFLPNSGNNNE